MYQLNRPNFGAYLFVLAVAGCGANADPDTSSTTADAGRSSASTGGGTDVVNSSGGSTVASGGAANSSGGSAVSGAGGASTAGGAGTGQGGSGGSGPKVYPPGPAGCGLDAAAFCDTFDAPAGKMTRAGELDPTKWSAARMAEIGSPSTDDHAVAIRPAKVPSCRGGLPAQVFPSQDALICDATGTIQSNHLMVLVAAQNYGQNTYRIRQPFDFANRTGHIVFDAEGYNVGNHGWVSLEITEDPTPAPSFTIQQNFENGAVPRNGVEIQLGLNCSGVCVGISSIIEYDDFAQRVLLDGIAANVSVPAVQTKLNHFEVRLSSRHVDVYATPASDNGTTFGTPKLIGSADLKLSFTRGYVHMTTHNHATLKYSNGTIDAWVTRWDNVGFDGPAMVGAFREYEAMDSLTPATSGMINVAYRLNDAAKGPAQTIDIPGVDPTGAKTAKIALENWSYHAVGSPGPADYAINYRLNGHTWHARKLDPSELKMMMAIDNAGTRSLMVDVDPAELAMGTNKLELTTSNAQIATPVALNIDLILGMN
jgi:hypothetical protein